MLAVAVHKGSAAVRGCEAARERPGVGVVDPRSQESELNVVPGGERQVLINLVVNHGPDLHSVRGEQRGATSDFNRLRDRAYAQLNIYARFLVQFEYDALSDGRCEALRFDADVVRAHGQARQVVDARRVALIRPGGASQYICCRHLGAGNRRARRVSHGAGDTGRHLLPASRWDGTQEKHSEDESPKHTC